MALSVPPQKLLRGSGLQLLAQHWGWAEQEASLPLVVEGFGGVEGLGPALELSPKPLPRAQGWCRGHSEEDNTSREGL